MTGPFRSSVVHAFGRTALPLAAYYAVTLALPLVNGAGRSGTAFVQHALVVLVVPPILVLLVCAVHAMVQVAAGFVRPSGSAPGASSYPRRRMCNTWLREDRPELGEMHHVGPREM